MIIDVHTHMLGRELVEALRKQPSVSYHVKRGPDGRDMIFNGDIALSPVANAMLDYDQRIADMDVAGVDMAIVSLTAPNIIWGTRAESVDAARIINQEMAHEQSKRPDRLRFLCSLPWQHADAAISELDRSVEAGSVGVITLANIGGLSLTDPAFQTIWNRIDQHNLPVLIHPTIPQGGQEMFLGEFGMAAAVGFMCDTTLAVARMIFDGFMDRFPNLSIIAPHGGATIPYLIGRLDQCHRDIPACSSRIKRPPSEYLKQMFVDSIVFRPDVLNLCLSVCGADQVMYGSDYPHRLGTIGESVTLADSLEETTRAKVFSGNALRVFKL